MTYVLYDIVNHQTELFSSTDVAAVMVLITQEDADAAEIDDKFLREPMSQNFTGALAPWHYMVSISEFFGVEGSQTLACVSKDIFKVLWDKCPDKRHALYGGESAKMKKEPKDLRSRKSSRAAREPKAAQDSTAVEQKTIECRSLSSYDKEVQKNYWSKIRNTLGPAMLQFFSDAGAIPTEKSYHPLSYARSVFSFTEIDSFFDGTGIRVPVIQIPGADLSGLQDNVSGECLSTEILRAYIAFDHATGDPTSGWCIAGENLQVTGSRFDSEKRGNLTAKLQAIWNSEGEESLIRSGLTLDGLVVDLFVNKPDLIPLWEACYKEVTGEQLYSLPPEELLKKQSAFSRNFEAKKWEPRHD